MLLSSAVGTAVVSSPQASNAGIAALLPTRP
ncbi:Uncharacterised protein [Acinetobacter baumannii]|nr:Uncharacterised protein [Acinetobacter baumannii]